MTSSIPCVQRNARGNLQKMKGRFNYRNGIYSVQIEIESLLEVFQIAVKAGNKRREIKRPPFCKGWPLFKNISAARSFAGLMAIQSSFLFSLVRRYLLELSLSTTGHLFSPWKRLLQNH